MRVCESDEHKEVDQRKCADTYTRLHVLHVIIITAGCVCVRWYGDGDDVGRMMSKKKEEEELPSRGGGGVSERLESTHRSSSSTLSSSQHLEKKSQTS